MKKNRPKKMKTNRRLIRKIAKHPWDETLVIAVMVVSALCVLILLASYISSTGKAAALPYNQATTESVLSMINGATVGNGSGKMICNVECTRRSEVCIAAHDDNNLVDCGARITGDYTCLCSNPARITAPVFLNSPSPPSSGEVVPSSCDENNLCLSRAKYCKDNICTPKKGEGTRCFNNNECLSNSCSAENPKFPYKTCTAKTTRR